VTDTDVRPWFDFVRHAPQSGTDVTRRATLPRVETSALRYRLAKTAQWFVGRAPSEAERGFLTACFGDSLQLEQLRIAASLGRRSWSPFGHRISLVRSHFSASDASNEIELADPRAAAVFAHEAMHVWQRQGGRRVTWEAIPLQAGYFAGADPYAYELLADPAQMLSSFLRANVEQQAKIFEDYVYRERVGADTSPFADVVRHIRTRA
jgi:hypothetical protein